MGVPRIETVVMLAACLRIVDIMHRLVRRRVELFIAVLAFVGPFNKCAACTRRVIDGYILVVVIVDDGITFVIEDSHVLAIAILECLSKGL